MVTILGAGGAIGSELVKEFTARNEPLRLVSRNPKLVPGAAEAVAADLSNLDDTVKAVTGSRIAFLLVGLKYDITEWRRLWPRPLRHAIEAPPPATAKFVFFHNLHMYGQVVGVMPEETPSHPSTQRREGELACQRFCEAFVHLHAGRRTESGAAGGERQRLESNMARSYCSRSADRGTVH